MPDNEAEIIEAMAKAMDIQISLRYGTRRDKMRHLARAAYAASPIERLETALAHMYVRGCDNKECEKCKLFIEVRAKHSDPGISPEQRRMETHLALFPKTIREDSLE